MAKFIQIRVEDSGVVARLASTIEMVPNVAGQALYTSVLAYLIPEARNNRKKWHNVFTCQLCSKLDATVTYGGAVINVDIDAIGVDYALNVEKGQPSGTTQDLNRLIQYARLKMGVKGIRALNLGRRLKSRIERNGTKAYPFVTTAYKTVESTLIADFIVRFDRGIMVLP